MQLMPNMQLDPTSFMKPDLPPRPDEFGGGFPIAPRPGPPPVGFPVNPFPFPGYPFPFPVPAPVEVDPRSQLNDLLAGGVQNPDGSINWDTVEVVRGVINQIAPSQVPPHEGPLMDPVDAILVNGLREYGIGGAMPTDHLGMPVFVPGGHEFMPPEMAAAIGLQALTEFAESFKAPLPGNPNVAMAPFALDLAIVDELNKRISDYLGTPKTAFMPYPNPVPGIGYGMAPVAPPEPVAPPMPVAPPIPGFPALA